MTQKFPPFFYKSFIAHKIRTYVWSERIGKLYLLPISRILPREGSKGRDKSAVRIFSVRQWKNRSNGKKHCKSYFLLVLRALYVFPFKNTCKLNEALIVTVLYQVCSEWDVVRYCRCYEPTRCKKFLLESQ
jgi:hypothetical protein